MSHDRFEVDRRLGEFANIGARALQPWNIGKGLFHRLGGVQQLLITAKAARDLQTERHGVLIDSAWNRNRRIGDERDKVGQSEPMIIVV